MKQVILRHAESDYDALMVAQGMEDAGANVFSVAWNGKPGTMLAFAVMGKYCDPVTVEAIDEAIERRRYPSSDA